MSVTATAALEAVEGMSGVRGLEALVPDPLIARLRQCRQTSSNALVVSKSGRGGAADGEHMPDPVSDDRG